MNAVYVILRKFHGGLLLISTGFNVGVTLRNATVRLVVGSLLNTSTYQVRALSSQQKSSPPSLKPPHSLGYYQTPTGSEEVSHLGGQHSKEQDPSKVRFPCSSMVDISTFNSDVPR